MANRYPLILDTSDGQIKELPNGDSLNLTGNSVIGVLNVTAQGTITAASIDAATINVNGLPINEVATSGDYNDLVNKPQNLSQFNNDTNFLAENSNISLLNNNSGYLTSVSWLQVTNKPTLVADLNLVDSVDTGTPISVFSNDVGYVTANQVEGLEALTGNYKGSVFGDDSTLLIDGVLSAVNLDGTIRGNVVPFVDSVYSLGTPVNEFVNVYANTFTGDLQGSVFSDDSSTQIIDAFNSIVNATQVDVTVPNGEAIVNLVYDGVAGTGELLGALQTFESGALTHTIRFTEQKIAMFKDVIGLQGTHLYADRYVISGLPVKINPSDINDLSVPTEDLEVIGNVKATLFKGDLIGSVFAEDSTPIVDATNGSLYYAATTPTDWNGTPPTTIGDAIDRLATLVKTLNGGTGA